MNTPLISLCNVSYHHNGRPILEHIDLKVAHHTLLAIIGPNGAGKTTLLRIVLGLIRPTTGSRHSQKIRISYVPQKTPLAPDIPITTERFLPQGRRKPYHHELLAPLHLDALQKRPLQRLSGGERQRVLLARAIVQEPDLLALDEPAAGIDSVSTQDFYHIIRRWQQHTQGTVVMVSHDLDFVMQQCDQIVCLNKTIRAIGTGEQLQRDPAFRQTFALE